SRQGTLGWLVDQSNRPAVDVLELHVEGARVVPEAQHRLKGRCRLTTAKLPQHSDRSAGDAARPRRRGNRMSNCVGGSDGSRLPCSTIAKHSVEGCDHFSHDGHDDDLGFFVGGDEAIVEGFEGGTVTACTEGSHVQDVTDRHPATIDAAMSLELAAVEV